MAVIASSELLPYVASFASGDVPLRCCSQPPRYCFWRSGGRHDRFCSLGLWSCSVWTAVMVPLRCAFLLSVACSEVTHSVVWYVDLAVNAFFGMGAILFRLRTSIRDEQAECEYMAPSVILRLTVQRIDFWADIFSLLPLLSEALWSEEFLPLRRCLPFATLLRTWRFFKANCHHHVEEERPNNYGKIVKIVAFLGLASHLIACMWFLLRDIAGNDNLQDVQPCHSLYTNALLEGAALICGLSIPSVNNDIERIFMFVIVIVAAVLVAAVFAHLVVLCHRMLILSNRRHEHMAFIQSATSRLGLEQQLRGKILRYHSFLQRHHNPDMYEALLGSLSHQLVTEIKLDLFRNFITNAPLLQNLCPDRVAELILSFEEFVYCPGDVIMHQDDVGHEMFFIVKGSCEVSSQSGEILAVKHKGDYFGEICLIFPNMRRTATIRAQTFCVLAQLTDQKFNDIIVIGSPERDAIQTRILSFVNVSAASRQLHQSPTPSSATAASPRIGARLLIPLTRAACGQDSPGDTNRFNAGTVSPQASANNSPTVTATVRSGSHNSPYSSPNRSPRRGKFLTDQMLWAHDGPLERPRAAGKAWTDVQFGQILRQKAVDRKMQTPTVDSGMPHGFSPSSRSWQASPSMLGTDDVIRQLKVVEVNVQKCHEDVRDLRNMFMNFIKTATTPATSDDILRGLLMDQGARTSSSLKSQDGFHAMLEAAVGNIHADVAGVSSIETRPQSTAGTGKVTLTL